MLDVYNGSAFGVKEFGGVADTAVDDDKEKVVKDEGFATPSSSIRIRHAFQFDSIVKRQLKFGQLLFRPGAPKPSPTEYESAEAAPSLRKRARVILPTYSTPASVKMLTFPMGACIYDVCIGVGEGSNGKADIVREVA